MEHSVAVYEFKSIAKGVQACDMALKTAGVQLISAEPICPGKFEMMIAGQLAQVEASGERLEKEFGEYIVDGIRLGRVDPTVVQALLGALPQPQPGALGIVETFTVASTVMAADSGVKAANVQIMELRVARGMAGKGFVSFTGEVADVRAAMDVAKQYAIKEGTFISESLIAAPHPELWNYL